MPPGWFKLATRPSFTGSLPNTSTIGIVGLVAFAVTARPLGLEVAPCGIRRAEDIASVFETIKFQADALYVRANNLVSSNRVPIITSALGARQPTIFDVSDYVQAGSLMSHGANFSDLFHCTAELVDKILRGTKPGDIPVEQPTKFDLVVNLTPAKAIGLTMPESFPALADEVIE